MLFNSIAFICFFLPIVTAGLPVPGRAAVVVEEVVDVVDVVDVVELVVVAAVEELGLELD